MRIAVSGSHSLGKSTVVNDFWWSGTYGTTFVVSPSTDLVGIVFSQNQTGPYSPIPYAIYLTPALALPGL